MSSIGKVIQMNKYFILFFGFTFYFNIDARVPKIYTSATEDMADTIFGFSLYKDEYNYTDPSGVFQKTFRNETHSITPMMLMFNWNKLWFNSYLDLGLEVNYGVGLNSGRGVFLDTQEVSDARFHLWIFPVDLGLYTELSLGYIAISASGGLSAAGMLQSRSDYEPSEKGKSRRQVGVGHYASAKFKINLNRIFRKNAFTIFRSYTSTRLTLNLESRYHHYANFQEDNVSISGMSFGVGFSFDFI